MYEYDKDFYQYINQGAVRSAEHVLGLLLDVLPLQIVDVLDVGCGAGAWLSVWQRKGCQVTGLDGAYVDRSMMLIDENDFIERDLRSPFSLKRHFDVVQCLEVAEHLPESSASGLVQSLCQHGDLVLFSAAPPGQGGENHINEQPYEYWRDQFEQCGFQMYDPLRRQLVDNDEIESWYRFNLFLYVRRDTLPELHRFLEPHSVNRNDRPADVSPILYQYRKWLVRCLPLRLQTALAVMKKHLFNVAGKFARNGAI